MALKQVFINNMKKFRKREKISQMKLAELCNTSPTYIGEIEVGKKFPSISMIEKIAAILRIEPYQFFIDRNDDNFDTLIEKAYPKLPKSMQKEIINKLNLSMNNVFKEVFEEY